jgi:tetratricopeptide (TPR) repeat protein
MFLHALLLTVNLTGQAAVQATQPTTTDALSQAYLLFLQARDLEDRSDVPGAVAAYRRASELVPSSAEIHAELAGVYARDGQAEAALKEGAVALSLDADNRTASRVLGLLKAEMAERSRSPVGQASLVAEAVKHLEVVRADRLTDPQLELTLGRLYVRGEQFVKAIEVLRLFLLDRPDYADGLVLLATAQEGTRAWKEAADNWSRLVRVQPRNVGYRARQGNALANSGDFDGAEEAFRAVIAAQPGNASALNYLGYMLAERGAKLDEAVELITRALAIDRDNPSFLDSLGWAYVMQAKLESARDPLQRAAAALPKTSVIQDHLAELYFRLKQYPEAVAAWDKALDGDRAGIDVAVITQKRDRAKALAK